VNNVLSFIDNEATTGKGTAVSMGIRQCTERKFKASNMNSSEDSSITPFHIHTIHKVTNSVCLSFD